MDRDFLIVGQGLAGSALALALREKGASVRVADASGLCSASEVAAGLVTPLAGKGMNPGWRQEEYLEGALKYYRRLEESSGRKLFYPFSVVRPFASEEEKAKFGKNKAKREPWIAPNGELQEAVKAGCGHFTMKGGGRLDTKAYLEVVREMLGADFVDVEVRAGDLEFESDGIVRWRGVRYGKVIFCSGFRGLVGGLFSFIPSRCAKGEMLTVKTAGLEPREILSRNGWMVPLGGEQWRAGASYAWDELDDVPTEQGRDEVQRRIEGLVDCEYEIVNHEAGVRPIVNNSQPVAGLHPEYDCVGIFNGLGSKGVVTSRAVALHVADFLLEKVELDAEIDYRRLLK